MLGGVGGLPAPFAGRVEGGELVRWLEEEGGKGKGWWLCGGGGGGGEEVGPEGPEVRVQRAAEGGVGGGFQGGGKGEGRGRRWGSGACGARALVSGDALYAAGGLGEPVGAGADLGAWRWWRLRTSAR